MNTQTIARELLNQITTDGSGNKKVIPGSLAEEMITSLQHDYPSISNDLIVRIAYNALSITVMVDKDYPSDTFVGRVQSLMLVYDATK